MNSRYIIKLNVLAVAALSIMIISGFSKSSVIQKPEQIKVNRSVDSVIKELGEVPRPEHPRPDFFRGNWMNLNGRWDFAFDPDNSGIREGWNDSKSFAEQIVVPFCPESLLSGIHDEGFHPICWYARSFDVADSLLGQRLRLHFGAVDYRADVWLNGILLGQHEGGYDPFVFDVTEIIKKRANRLVVRADDDPNELKPRGKQSPELIPSGCIYMRVTGIWQTVWLERVGSAFISNFKVFADPDKGLVKLNILTDGQGKNLHLSATIKHKGEVIAEVQEDLSRSSAVLNVSVPNPELWEPDNPVLYDLDLKLINHGGNEKDHVQSYFGFRKVTVSDGMISLNNKPFFLISALDQGYYPEGLYTSPTDEDLCRDIKWAKQYGLNNVRKHQIIPEPRFYYWCDKLGLTVWGEMPDWGADKQGKKFLEEWEAFLNRDFNHPSIIAWVPTNEWTNPNDENSNQSKVKLYEATKALDPTRLVIDNSGYCHTKTDITDLHVNPRGENGINAWGNWWDRWHQSIDETGNFQAYPDKPTYCKGFKHQGQPVIISEVGNWKITELPPMGSWEPYGYGHPFRNGLVETAENYLAVYRDYFLALMAEPSCAGFSYVQLYDVEGEVNGYLTYDRRPKILPERIAEIHSEGLRRRNAGKLEKSKDSSLHSGSIQNEMRNILLLVRHYY